MSGEDDIKWIKDNPASRVGMNRDGFLIIASKDEPPIFHTVHVDAVLTAINIRHNLENERNELKRQVNLRHPNGFLKDALAQIQIRANSASEGEGDLSRGICLGNLEAMMVLRKFIPSDE